MTGRPGCPRSARNIRKTQFSSTASLLVLGVVHSRKHDHEFRYTLRRPSLRRGRPQSVCRCKPWASASAPRSRTDCRFMPPCMITSVNIRSMRSAPLMIAALRRIAGGQPCHQGRSIATRLPVVERQKD